MDSRLTHGQNLHAEREFFRAQDASIVAEIAAEIDKSCREWEEGRSCSPSQRDFVIYARRVLERRLPNFIGTTEEGEDFLADVLYEDAGETYVTSQDIAAFLYDQLTAE